MGLAQLGVCSEEVFVHTWLFQLMGEISWLPFTTSVVQSSHKV